MIQRVSCHVGRAILLDDIIENITLKSSYYQEKTITMELKGGTKLHKIMQEQNIM
jgi:hypothetical protein